MTQDLRALHAKTTQEVWEVRPDLTVNAGTTDAVEGAAVWAAGKSWTITDWCEKADAAFVAAMENAVRSVLSSLQQEGE